MKSSSFNTLPFLIPNPALATADHFEQTFFSQIELELSGSRPLMSVRNIVKGGK